MCIRDRALGLAAPALRLTIWSWRLWTVRPAVSVNSAGTAAWTMQARPAPTILAPITTAPEPCSAQLIPSDLGWSWNSLPIIAFSSFFSNTYGGPGRTRTCDLWFRKPLLYPAELRSLSASPRVAERSNQFASDVLNSRGSSVARNRAGADRSHKPGSRSHRPAVVDMARSHSPGKRSRILIGGRRSRNVDRHGRSRSRSCSHSRLAGNHSHRANGHNGCLLYT